LLALNNDESVESLRPRIPQSRIEGLLLDYAATHPSHDLTMQANKTVTATKETITVSPDENYNCLAKVTVNPPTSQSKTAKSTTTRQTIIPGDGYDYLNSVIVDSLSLQSKTVTANKEIQTVEPDNDYDYLSGVTVNPPTSQSKTVTLSVAAQTIIPDDGYDYLSSVTVHAKSIESVIFGYDINLSDSNPSTRVSYPSDVMNASFASAAMDSTSDIFNYGDWEHEFFMPKPCMLKTSGLVDYYLDSSDYSKRVDGTASDVADLTYDGNAMMQWPIIYTKRWETDGIYHFRCSPTKIDDDYECWSNYDKDNKIVAYFYTPIYNGCYDTDGKLRSISGQAYGCEATVAQEMSGAALNGDGYTVDTYSDRQLINDLLTLISKSTDAQSVFGMGHVSDTSVQSSQFATGLMDSKGLFWGDITAGMSGVKVFGMENWWGEQWRGIAGLIIDNGTVKVKATRGTYDGSTATDYNTTGDGYITLFTLPEAISDGWIKTTTTYSTGRLPYAIGGSSSTYESDYIWINKSIVALAMAGGNLNYGLNCGPLCWVWNFTAGLAAWNRGASLSYR